MREQPGHNVRLNAQFPLDILGKNAWMTSQLNEALILKLRWLSMCLAYLLTFYPLVFARPDTGRRPVDWCRNSILYCTTTCYFLMAIDC